jgi:hypothetical protein
MIIIHHEEMNQNEYLREIFLEMEIMIFHYLYEIHEIENLEHSGV